MKQKEKHTIVVEVDPAKDIDYGNFTVRAKVIVDGTEYSAFYDMCNLVPRDQNGKVVELDSAAQTAIGCTLDEVIGIDLT